MIVGVAIRDGDGNVWSLPQPNRHIHLQDVYPQVFEQYDSGLIGVLGEHGFVDEDGSFYTRAEAATHAFDQGQLMSPRLALYSEDLW